jgi:nucleoside-diphosphate-sugar epimerase
MKDCVTGGASCFGPTLVPLPLNEDHSVGVLENLNHEGARPLAVWSDPFGGFRYGDIRCRSAIPSALSGMQAVIHLAVAINAG